jgi:hypothetical protein
LEEIEAALKLPVPTSFPQIKDKRLRQLLTGDKSGLEDAFVAAYHPRWLEWVGDRTLASVVAETLFVLAPREAQLSGEPHRAEANLECVAPFLSCTSPIADRCFPFSLPHRFSRLVKNTMNEKLAIQLNLTGALGPDDRWEAHLAALAFSNGRSEVVKLLVPLIRQEFFNCRPLLLELYQEQKNDLYQEVRKGLVAKSGTFLSFFPPRRLRSSLTLPLNSRYQSMPSGQAQLPTCPCQWRSSRRNRVRFAFPFFF